MILVYLEPRIPEPGTPGRSGGAPPPAPRGLTHPGQLGPSDVCSARASNSNRPPARGRVTRPEPFATGVGGAVPDAPGAPQSRCEGPLAPARGLGCVCARSQPPGAARAEGARPGRGWYVPADSAPSRFPAPGPAWRPELARRPDRGPELPWPSGGRRRGCASAAARPPRPAAATRRTASSRSRRKTTPGPRR